MDVYVESNFVLELALLQEQHGSCENILERCETGKTQLIVPSYSLVEPYETLSRYAKNRTRLSFDLANEVKQLARSKPYKDDIEDMQKITGFLVRSQEDEKERLKNTLNRLIQVAEIIPLTSKILLSAMKYQVEHDLLPQDSIVYASVLDHMDSPESTSKCFLNRNSKDFDDPDIVETLRKHGCKMLFRFDHGHGYITSHLSS